MDMVTTLKVSAALVACIFLVGFAMMLLKDWFRPQEDDTSLKDLLEWKN